MKAVLFANTDWYLYNFRLAYAQFLKSKGWDVILMSPAGVYAEKLKELGFRHIALEFSRKGMNPAAEHDTVRRIREVYAAERPDLVHHFTIKCMIYGSFAARQVGIKSVVNSVTGLGFVFLSRKPSVCLLRALIKGLYKKAFKGTQVIFENPDDRALFLKMGLVDERSSHVILGTGIDTEAFVPVRPPDTTPLTILPARMLWDKGIGEFVEAATAIRAEGIQARFALIGKLDEGNPACVESETLTRWQKEGNVEWWGWQEDIYACISLADIVCLPSYREGLPKILLEAASCGRPIVTTDVPGCREIVIDGLNGLLVQVKSAEALKDALLRLIKDRDLRIKMGEAGRELAVSRFSTEIVNRETYKIYLEALGGKAAEEA